MDPAGATQQGELGAPPRDGSPHRGRCTDVADRRTAVVGRGLIEHLARSPADYRAAVVADLNARAGNRRVARMIADARLTRRGARSPGRPSD